MIYPIKPIVDPYTDYSADDEDTPKTELNLSQVGKKLSCHKKSGKRGDLESMIQQESKLLNSDEKLANQYKDNTDALAMARVVSIKEFMENKSSSIIKKA